MRQGCQPGQSSCFRAGALCGLQRCGRLNSSAGRLGLLDLRLPEDEVVVFTDLCRVVILKKLTIEI